MRCQVGAVRGATRAQGARLVLVITSGSSAAGAGHVEGPVQEERVSTLCRQGGIERRSVLSCESCTCTCTAKVAQGNSFSTVCFQGRKAEASQHCVEGTRPL